MPKDKKPRRTTISAKTRFSVMKRDGFRCHYCGAAAPDATLVIDHIVPVAAGGTNDEGNLLTSCETCNSGKAADPVIPAPTQHDDDPSARSELIDILQCSARAAFESSTDPREIARRGGELRASYQAAEDWAYVRGAVVALLASRDGRELLRDILQLHVDELTRLFIRMAAGERDAGAEWHRRERQERERLAADPTVRSEAAKIAALVSARMATSADKGAGHA